MSQPKALKAHSLRDSLAKTVRLLTKQGVNVQFRGHQPFVQTQGDKVVRLVLPELNDNASDDMVQAIQGFLDHEIGHIFYTPFARAARFAGKDKKKHSLANIIEDIRLEKLLPRDLPGTRENLERMYVKSIPLMFEPHAIKANAPGIDKSEAFSGCLVIAMRALAGQKPFKKLMDDHNLWPHVQILLTRMPDISKQLRALETFQDVERLVTALQKALEPPAPQASPPEDEDDDQATPPPPPPPANSKDEDDADDSDQDGDDDSDGESEDNDGDDEEGGCGHGDGSGEDDGEGEDDDDGECSGGDAGADSDDEEGEDGDEECPPSSTPADSDLEGESNSEGTPARENLTLRQALAMLEPTQRRALYMYKKQSKRIAEIANDLNITEDGAVDLLSHARRRLRTLLNGG